MLHLFQHFCFPFTVGNLAVFHRGRHFQRFGADTSSLGGYTSFIFGGCSGLDFQPSGLSTFSMWHVSGGNLFPLPNKTLSFTRLKNLSYYSSDPVQVQVRKGTSSLSLSSALNHHALKKEIRHCEGDTALIFMGSMEKNTVAQSSKQYQ